MTPGSAPLAVRRELEPTHPCIRCGREGVPAEDGLCELCNPLALSQPSATQMHGIAAVGIIAFVLVLAVLARSALAGTGPFEGSVGAVTAAANGLFVTLVVANQGTKDAATICVLTPTQALPGNPIQVVQTPLVRAGASVEFTTVVTRFGSTPIGLVADCQSP